MNCPLIQFNFIQERTLRRLTLLLGKMNYATVADQEYLIEADQEYLIEIAESKEVLIQSITGAVFLSIFNTDQYNRRPRLTAGANERSIPLAMVIVQVLLFKARVLLVTRYKTLVLISAIIPEDTKTDQVQKRKKHVSQQLIY